MTSDDWRRQRAEEIFGSDPMPWIVSPPKAKPIPADDPVRPMARPRPPSAAPAAKPEEPAAPPKPAVSSGPSAAHQSAAAPFPASARQRMQPPEPAADPRPRSSVAGGPDFSSRRHGAARPSVEDELRWIRVDPPAPPPAEPPVHLFERPRSAAPWRWIAAIAAVILALSVGWLARSYVDPRATPLVLPPPGSTTATPSAAVTAPAERTEAAPVPIEPVPDTSVVEPGVVAPGELASAAPPVAAPAGSAAPVITAGRSERVAPYDTAAVNRPEVATARTEPVPASIRPPADVARTDITRTDVARLDTGTVPARPAATQVTPRPLPVQPVPRPAPVQVATRTMDLPAPAAAPMRNPRGLANRPSFDCRRTTSAITRAICGDPELAALDRQLASRFIALNSNADRGTVEAIHEGETTFLNDRQSCTDRDCLVEVYRNRLRQLDEVEN